jgi:hypothetical protein
MNDTIIEAAKQALYKTEDLLDVRCGDDDDAHNIVHAIVAAVTPLIRADALEEAARVVEGEPFCSTSEWLNDQIAAAIRALKDQP